MKGSWSELALWANPVLLAIMAWGLRRWVKRIEERTEQALAHTAILDRRLSVCEGQGPFVSQSHCQTCHQAFLGGLSDLKEFMKESNLELRTEIKGGLNRLHERLDQGAQVHAELNTRLSRLEGTGR